MSRYKPLQDNCLQEYISKAVMRSVGGGIKGMPKLLSNWGRRVKKPAPVLVPSNILFSSRQAKLVARRLKVILAQK